MMILSFVGAIDVVDVVDVVEVGYGCNCIGSLGSSLCVYIYC